MIRKDLFTFTLNQLLSGAVATRLSEELHECIEAARTTRKAAKLSFELRIKPLGDTGQYEIKETSKQTLPELERGITILWGTPEGNLESSNPRQASLFENNDQERSRLVHTTAERLCASQGGNPDISRETVEDFDGNDIDVSQLT